MTEDQNVQPDGEGLTRRKLVGTGIAAIGATVVWGSPVPFSRKGIGQSIESGYAAATGATGPNSHSDGHEPPPGTGGNICYCAADGNTFPDGRSIPKGTFLQLLANQPSFDPHYAGATLAIYVDQMGLTCPPAPPGFVNKGFYNGPDQPPNLYQFWARP